MPEALERELRTRGRKKGLSQASLDAYIYGTLRKSGWKPSGEGMHSPEESSIDTGHAIVIEDPQTLESKWALVKELGLTPEDLLMANPPRRRSVATVPTDALKNLKWGM